MAKLIGIWCAVILAILAVVNFVWRKPPAPPTAPSPVVMEKEIQKDQEIALLQEALPACSRAFFGFLSGTTPEERNQFVTDPVRTASLMARFYSMNPMVQVDPASLTLAQHSVVHLPAGKAVQTIWHSKDDQELDALFIKEEGEWRLDWSHFVRFSDLPWVLFLAGSGGDTAEFRLLARERLADQRKTSETISIVLYAPRPGSLYETGFQSPEFLVRRDSENGHLLEEAFRLQREGTNLFGSKLNPPNPENLIRVRVKVRRVAHDLERHFELEKVIACHWFTEDDPGIPAKH